MGRQVITVEMGREMKHEDVVYTGQNRTASKGLVGMPKPKSILERPRRRTGLIKRQNIIFI